MIEVLKQALEALELCNGAETVDGVVIYTDQEIAAIKQAIAELESQEPVATVTSETGADITMSWWHEPALPMGTKLFTHPPQRTWVGLTDEERSQLVTLHHGWNEYAQAIKSKLKERNI
jgi:hypothetical protein